MERTITYFEELKPENTDVTFRLAKERLKSEGIKKIVIASTTGATARKALEFFGDAEVTLIVVPHQHAFRKEKNPFPEELAAELRGKGHEVHFGTMLFHTDNLYESKTPTVMANLLRCFCQGVKVCFEIVLMATDAGHLAVGEKVIAIAGTGRGSDTALVMQAGSSQNFRKMRVNEMLCKPLNPVNIEELMEMYGQEKK